MFFLLAGFYGTGRGEETPLSPGDYIDLLLNGTVEQKISAAQALAELQDRSALSALDQALSDPEPKVRYYVIQALGSFRDPAVEASLAKALLDTETENRLEALRQIYKFYLGSEPPKGFKRLLRTVLPRQVHKNTYPWKQVASEVVQSFETWLMNESNPWKERALEACLHLKMYTLTPRIAQLLSHEKISKNVVLLAFRVLGELQDCSTLRVLTSWIQHEDIDIVNHTAWALAQCAYEVPNFASIIYDVYMESQKESRKKVLYRALALSAPEKAHPLFLHGLMSKDKRVRRLSAEALGRLRKAEDVYTLAVHFLQEKDDEARLGMAYGLFLLGRLEYAVVFLQALKEGGDREDQVVAYMLESPAQIFPELFRFFDQIHDDLKKKILSIAGQTGEEELLSYLQGFMKSENEELAITAFDAFRQIQQAIKLRKSRQTGDE